MSVGARIAGIAMALPERLVSNDQIAAGLGVDAEWIAKRTGTRERAWAAADERLSELAASAGTAALARAAIDACELDLVLVATSTADEITPNAAPLVAGLIGAEGAGALDVGAACTGWLSALAMACGQIESGRAQHALVVGADFLSRFLDVSDPTPRRYSQTVRAPQSSRRPTSRAAGSGRSCCAPITPDRT
jgi:3-oxoacyl-[acyl-carrier-protein] synthase III